MKDILFLRSVANRLLSIHMSKRDDNIKVNNKEVGLEDYNKLKAKEIVHIRKIYVFFVQRNNVILYSYFFRLMHNT